MKSKNTPFLLLPICALLLMSCEIDNLIEGAQGVAAPRLENEFKDAFSLDGFEDPTALLADNISIDWGNVAKDTLEGKLWHEFRVVEKRPMRYEDGRTLAYNYTVLAHRDETGEITFYLAKMLSFGDDREHTYFGLEKDFFHGMVYLYDMEGGTDYFMHYQKGKAIFSAGNGTIGNGKNGGKPLHGKLCMEKADLSARCDGDATSCMLSGGNDTAGCGGGGGGYVQARIVSWTEWYNVRPGGAMELSNIQNHADRYEWQWVPGTVPTGTNGPTETNVNYAVQALGGSVSYSNAPPKNVVQDPNFIVLDKKLKEHPCATNIILDLRRKDFKRLVPNKLGGFQGSSHLSKTILDLFARSPNYNLTFKIESLGNDPNGNKLNGRTRKISNTHWEIVLDQSLTKNGTSLFVAKTIIHESMHAFVNYLTKAQPTGDVVQDINRYMGLNDVDNNFAQHQFISEYVDAMAISLAVWDNYSKPMDYYKKLSWGGLETSSAYKALKETEKQAIQKTIQNERFNRSGALGQKCN